MNVSEVLKGILFIICLAVCSVAAFAGKLHTVEGEYTYVLPSSMSLEEGKQIALERAIISALADKFGTVMSQDNTSRISNVDGNGSQEFYSLTGSMVRGEWIETIGEPQYSFAMSEEGMTVITVKVRGKARSREIADVTFSAKLLRNGIEDSFESDTFNDNDHLYLKFRSPESGYLAVYLLDDAGNACCLLPYERQSGGIMPIRENEEYVFFSVEVNRDLMVDELVLTANKAVEYNDIYIIFSPNRFVKAVDNASETRNADGLELPRMLPERDFYKWLAKLRTADTEMQVDRRTIAIRRPQ